MANFIAVPTDPTKSPQKLDTWEKRTEWPLAAIALIFLAAYAIDVLAQPKGAAAMAVDIVTWVSWLIFALDYLVRLILAADHWRWFYRHLFDLLVVVLPLLRPLRLVRHQQGARRDRAAACPGAASGRAVGARHRKVRQVAAARATHQARLPTWTVQQARPGCS
jgi:hypothetical protein